LPEVLKPLTHNTPAKLFIGADEVMARIRLLGDEELRPGQTGWLQLELEEPVVALRGDRYILRRPSPSETMGGGIVLDPQPAYRHKRFDEEVLNHLRALSGGDPEDILRQIIQRSGILGRRELITQSSIDPQTAAQALSRIAQGDAAILIDDGGEQDQLIADPDYWENVLRGLISEVERYHETFPLRLGMPKEELRSQSTFSEDIFQAAIRTLSQENRLTEKGPLVALPSHQIRFNADQKEQIESLMAKFQRSPTSPPTVDECLEAVGEEVYNALVSLGELKPVSTEVVFRRETYQKMVADIKAWLEEKDTIKVAEARDYFDSSRRYMLDFLEHLDREGVTIREGDIRRLR
jgi:selenocysteine-specific elongation factor